jgi:hypothetical protein
VRRRGRVVLDRAIGHSAGNGPAYPPDAADRARLSEDTGRKPHRVGRPAVLGKRSVSRPY